MFGLLNKKSNGLENILAKCTIYSVELNSQYYNIYIESRLPLYLFIYNFDIQKMMHTIFDMDDNKMKILQIIIKKILIKAKDINVLPYEIYVTKDGFLPSEFDKLMINSYNNYTSPVKISNKDIYNISLCHNIFMNRKRLLYRDCYDMFNKDNKIYDDIQIFCSKYCNNNISIKKIIQDKNRLICGELDMYDATEEKIIDFKTSTSNNIQIEWILQLLTYTALMRLENKLIVKYISIYNPINGIETIINIENWNKETELLDYFKKVRDGKEKPLQKKETIKKIDKNKYPLFVQRNK
jgi:hypothetical protein